MRFCKQLFSGLPSAEFLQESSPFCVCCFKAFLVKNENFQADVIIGLAHLLTMGCKIQKQKKNAIKIVFFLYGEAGSSM